MFHVESMRPQDYQFATELANTMNWNMAPQDFEYNHMLEPDGCLMLWNNSEPIGIATCIGYGKVGWFGNLIINPQNRKQSAGGFLLKHAIGYLHDRGVEAIGLYAYPHLVGFYGKFGFKADMDFTYLKSENLPSIKAEQLPRIRKQDLPAIASFDHECFGGDRTRLLQSIFFSEGNLGYFATEEGKIIGYASANVYEGMAEVAPLVCNVNHPDVALKLLNAVLAPLAGSEVYACLPRQNSPLHDALTRLGFKEEFYVTRMHFGTPVAKNCIYVAESLERG